jgi:hypothetical protein
VESPRNEQYGTWRDWTRGPSSVTLIAPRLRQLAATQLAWSASTPAAGTVGDVVALPTAGQVHDSAGFARWLATVRGKFVLMSPVQPSCRPDSSWRMWASPATYAAILKARDSAHGAWEASLARGGHDRRAVVGAVARAGVAGLISNAWSHGWGVDKIMSANSGDAPAFNVSCEDYALLARLVSHNQHPRVQAIAQATVGGLRLVAGSWSAART